MFPSDTGLAVRIAVLAAYGERRLYSLLAHRGGFVTNELRIDATPHGFRYRDPRVPGVAGQLSVLVFSQVDPGTYHIAIPLRHREVLRAGLFGSSRSQAADTSSKGSLPMTES